MENQNYITTEDIIAGTELYYPEKYKEGKAIIGYIAFTAYGFQRVHCVDIDGVAVYGGDIVLGTTEHMAEVEALCQEHGITHFNQIPLESLHPHARASVKTSKPWPNRTVYYTIDSSVEDPNKVEQAVQAWRDTGLFNMITWTSDLNQPNYIKVQNTEPGYFSRGTGMQGGMQIINLQDGYSVGNAIHEFGHAIGLNHEQKRHDTQSSLNILWDNIQDAYVEQFTPSHSGVDIGHYNYYSIMEYGRTGFHKEHGQNTLVPYDDNTIIGQRTGLSVGDINGAQAIYNEAISAIQVTLVTGSNATNGDVFLGIGGREFCLNNSGNDRSSNSTDVYVLGAGATVNNASNNDPRDPALSVRDIVNFPVYIRLTGTDGWSLTEVTVTISGVHPDNFPDFSFKYRPGAINLNSISTQSIQLMRYPATGEPLLQGGLNIDSIAITVDTGSSATNDTVYLGIAGREFCLDKLSNDFSSNSTDTFVFGSGSNVLNASVNDPRTPNLIIDDLNNNPVYLRKGGTDDWDISTATVVVTYKDNIGSTNYPTVSFDLAAGGIELTENGGEFVGLKYANRVEHLNANISKITAVIETGGSATNDYVYLGIAGREFLLNTSGNNFSSNDSETFIFGAGSNVSHASDNNPCDPQLTLLDLATYQAYTRKNGTDAWVISSAAVTVDFADDTPSIQLTNCLSDLKLDNDYGMSVSLEKQ